MLCTHKSMVDAPIRCIYTYISLFIALYIAVCLPRVVLFGVMATRLNKHHYHYHYHYYYYEKQLYLHYVPENTL